MLGDMRGSTASATVPAATTHTSDRDRVTAVSWAGRVAALIDGLVDRAHGLWPLGYGVLHLPTGESVFVPAHRPDDPACAGAHVGYFASRIGPNCGANPLPRQRGGSGLRPLALDWFAREIAGGTAPAVRHVVDLRTGELWVEHVHRDA